MTIVDAKPFKCKECGWPNLNEIVVGATRTTMIHTIEANGITDYKPGIRSNGGEFDRFECANCGVVVATCIEELVKYVS